MISSRGKRAIQDAHTGFKRWSRCSNLDPLLYRFITTDHTSESRQRRSPRPRYSSANRVPRDSIDNRAATTRFSPSTCSVPPASPEKRPARSENGRKNAQTPKLLKPYDLALQLKQLCAQDNLDGAVERLQSVPRDAQNTAVWNTMLSLCMSQRRFQLAYTLFTDMKRRGFSPKNSTFTTMLKGLSRISDWQSFPKQLVHAHALYEHYLRHIESVKYHEPDNVAELCTSPLVAYINILGTAGELQKIFDVYFAMDQDGPGAPDKFVFTAMLRAIANHQEQPGDMSVRDTATSDAKHVWLQIEKTMQKRPDFDLDSRLIAASIRALTRGRPNDQNLALNIIGEHLGLTRPGDPGPMRLSKHLNSWTLDAALQVCIVMQKFRLCVHFMHQVMDKVDFENPYMRSILGRTHVHKLIRAQATLATLASPNESSEAIEVLEWCLKNDAIYYIPGLRPDTKTYHLVLLTCLRNSDWEGAVKTFQLMTGIQADAFHESEGKAPPKVQKQPRGRSLSPDVETMSFLMRTALQTKHNTNCLQAIWLAEYVGIETMLQDENAEPYYRGTLARAMGTTINRLMDDPRTEHRRAWFSLVKIQAQEVARSLENAISPESERMTLGSMAKLAQEDEAAAFDLAARSTKPRK
ncbi:hypothetical protein PAXRUDRAFT_135440 [Paxillus rubicundulus Ve08.2h10]|uniref:Uncharacterized protein n=1 Tax=Paxillus rubicundulus Ve08.2h10 TaxID=930991 RepID=A0A0D0EBM3_9AGAM|nr:hypothetical protein PAXRUDRAFT_135440 [Paxillus rubicundulus Ve08.2h10]